MDYTPTPNTDALYNSDFHRWDGEPPDFAYHRMTELSRDMEKERNTHLDCLNEIADLLNLPRGMVRHKSLGAMIINKLRELVREGK